MESGGLLKSGNASLPAEPNIPTNARPGPTEVVGSGLSPYGGMTTGHMEHGLNTTDNAAILGAVVHQTLGGNSSARRESIMSAGMLGVPDDGEEDSDDDNLRGEKRAGRRKIRIEYIEDKSRRHITFSKRKAGIMKKVVS
jgi:hypothetical protein